MEIIIELNEPALSSRLTVTKSLEEGTREAVRSSTRPTAVIWTSMTSPVKRLSKVCLDVIAGAFPGTGSARDL
jgi:hypothetical protein